MVNQNCKLARAGLPPVGTCMLPTMITDSCNIKKASESFAMWKVWGWLCCHVTAGNAVAAHSPVCCCLGLKYLDEMGRLTTEVQSREIEVSIAADRSFIVLKESRCGVEQTDNWWHKEAVAELQRYGIVRIAVLRLLHNLPEIFQLTPIRRNFLMQR